MTLEEFFKQAEPFNAIRLIGPLPQKAPGLRPSEYPILYIDGGLKHRLKAPHLHFSIGDGDSSPYSPDLLLNPDKNFSDLEFALSQLPARFETLFLEGFLGGRKDHEWINLGVIYNFLSRRQPPARVILENDQVYALSAGQWTLTVQGLFSLLCFDDMRLKLTGRVKYSYTRPEPFPRLSSYGLSNEGQGEIHIDCDRPVFLVRGSS